MTYCVGISVEAGLCFISDSRTNAGVDNVSIYSKLYQFGVDGERQIAILSAGNLATTQGVITQIKRDIKDDVTPNILSISHMEDVADYVGELSVAQQEKHASGGNTFEASFIVGGQIKGRKPSVYRVYSAGNYIKTSDSTPFLQIGESKYGKPILDRIIVPESSLDTAAMCGLVSMDSTIKSNLSVGPPIEVMIYQRDSFKAGRHYIFEESSDYLREVSKAWDEKLREAFASMPPIAWSGEWDDANTANQKALIRD
jgi:putative proteasome-type protease